MFDREWLADADLMIMKVVPKGEFSRPLYIENFSFGKPDPR
jgi:hypothetical protein